MDPTDHDRAVLRLIRVSGPPYVYRLFDEHNKDSSYLYMKRYVQMLQSSWAPDSHWTLKSPIHALYLRSLLQQFPDARIVTTHRYAPRGWVNPIDRANVH